MNLAERTKVTFKLEQRRAISSGILETAEGGVEGGDGVRWSWFVGQIGGVVKVYSGV